MFNFGCSYNVVGFFLLMLYFNLYSSLQFFRFWIIRSYVLSTCYVFNLGPHNVMCNQDAMVICYIDAMVIWLYVQSFESIVGLMFHQSYV